MGENKAGGAHVLRERRTCVLAPLVATIVTIVAFHDQGRPMAFLLYFRMQRKKV